ncbi:hypothetical protein [Sulfitobacter phage vB_SupP_AX]|nr:hypothetical protein [Sulfitobacter phage vB_SupP_AX]
MRLPTYVNVSKKTTKACNLNIYRNLHHHHLNTQKKRFEEEVAPLLRDKPTAEKVWIHYEIFAPRNGRLDTMNVGSIVDKYFSDTLVNFGKLPDDNQEHIVLSTFSFGGVCPMDGHAIATVNILSKEKEDMRILLDESDIQNALNAYVKTLQLPNAEDAEVEISVTDDGEIEAEVIMGEAKPKNKGGRPRGSKTRKPAPKKEEVTADVEETTPDSDAGDSTDSDSGGSEPSEEPAKSGATEAPKAGGKGNLFGDSDEKASSDSPTETEAPKEDGPPKVKTKKSSIFDVD